MTKWLLYSHRPARHFHIQVFCLFFCFHHLTTKGSGLHSIPQTKHVPHASSPVFLSLVCMENFCFNFLNTLCLALAPLSGKAIPWNIQFFSFVFSSGHLQGQSIPPSGKQLLVKRRLGTQPSKSEKDDLRLLFFLAECWFLEGKGQKKWHRPLEMSMRGRVGRWAGNKEPDELSLQLGFLWRVWVSTEHLPQLEPRTPGALKHCWDICFLR